MSTLASRAHLPSVDPEAGSKRADERLSVPELRQLWDRHDLKRTGEITKKGAIALVDDLRLRLLGRQIRVFSRGR